MWRKPNEAKPSSAVPEPTASQSSSSAIPSTSSPAAASFPAQAAFSAAPPASTPAPVPANAQVPYSAPAAAVSLGTHASQFGPNLKINGEITGDSDLLIEGQAQGKIRLPGSKVTVGPQGRVQADIEAREIYVLGILTGNLKASDRVTLGPTSRVQGSVLTRRIAIEDGARLRGKVEMTRADESTSVSSAPPALAAKPALPEPAAPLPLSAASGKV